MPKLEYFLVAESYARDQSSHALSIFNVLQEISFESFPAIIPSVSLIACWICSADEITEELDHVATFAFKMPDGTDGKEFTGSFIASDRVQQLVYKIAYVPIDRNGELAVELRLNGEYQASHSIMVTKQDNEKALP